MLEPLLNKVPVLLNKIEIKLSRNKVGIFFILKHKITLLYLLSFIRFITRCHSLSLFALVVIPSHSLYHSLSLVVPLIAIRCTTRCHSLPLVAIRCHSLYPRCHSMNQSSVFLQTIVRSRSCLCSSERNNRKNKLTDLIFLSLWKIQIEKKL